MKPADARALVVDDDRSWQQILSEILVDYGLEVDVADSLEAGQPLIRRKHRLAIVDLALDGRDHRNQDGLRVLEAIRRDDPGCICVLLTGYATVELAVSAIKQYGAYDCLRKEVFNRSRFQELLRQALAGVEAAEKRGRFPAVEAEASAGLKEDEESPLLLVVEDDGGWRGILEELLSDEGYRLRLCGGYGEALGYLRREKFKLAVIDLSLNKDLPLVLRGNERNLYRLEGYRLLASIQAGGTPVIVLSGLSDPAAIEKTFSEQRIFAYLEKQTFNRKVFLQTVSDAISTSIAQRDLEVLTDREREVLDCLARGMTNKEIADRLVITTNTVKRHLKAIFSKLDIHTRSAAVAKISGKS